MVNKHRIIGLFLVSVVIIAGVLGIRRFTQPNNSIQRPSINGWIHHPSEIGAISNIDLYDNSKIIVETSSEVYGCAIIAQRLTECVKKADLPPLDPAKLPDDWCFGPRPLEPPNPPAPPSGVIDQLDMAVCGAQGTLLSYRLVVLDDGSLWVWQPPHPEN